MNQTIGQRIKRALELRGMRQAALAEAVGTSPAAVTAWVSDRKPPKAENLQAVADALGVDASWLQFGQGEAPEPDPAEERAAYREALEWYWQETPKDGQRVLGDPAGHVFELKPNTLVRETGQNTLDELLEGEQTVKIEYTIIDLEGSEAKEFLDALRFESNLRPHLEACAQEEKRKHAAVIAGGLEQLDRDGRLRLVRIADYGANGLTGPEYDPGRFTAVCRNTLDSFKGESAGGSYGLGKATMWTASWMGVVVTNSTLSVPEGEISDNRFFVRAELPWHNDSKDWSGPGWFGERDVDRGCTRSYAGNATLAKDLLVERSEGKPGTTFLIVGAYDPSGEAEEELESLAATIREEVAKNFWAAMVPRGDRPPRLRAVVRTQRGRKQVSEQKVDPRDYVRPMVETLEKFYEGEQVEGLSEVGDVIAVPVVLNIPERRGSDPHPRVEHEATLLVAYTDEPADDDSIGKVVYLRGNNMTIKDYKLTPLPLGAKQFNAILLAGLAAGESPANRQGEKFLRAAEPPAHNKWQGTPDLTSRYARGGAKAIGDFEARVKDAIREAVRDRGGGGDEGPEPLKELLRLLQPQDKHTRPRVKKVSADLDSTSGVWTMEAVVSVPPGSRWSFAPVLRFGTESGPPIAVGWQAVEARKRCQVEDGRLRSDGGARTVVFRAESDPATYPVRFDRARVRLDLGRVHRIEG